MTGFETEANRAACILAARPTLAALCCSLFASRLARRSSLVKLSRSTMGQRKSGATAAA